MFIKFIDKLGPEFLFVVGVLVIFAYVATKSIPLLKDFKYHKMDIDHEIKLKEIEQAANIEDRKNKEATQAGERDREQIKVMAAQNDIMKSLVSSNQAMTMQMQALANSLDNKAGNIEEIKETTNDTQGLVKDIHKVIIKDHRS